MPATGTLSRRPSSVLMLRSTQSARHCLMPEIGVDGLHSIRWRHSWQHVSM